MAILGFPDGFLWGAATSSQQIEGARDADGRGESIWDRFAATPGKIADGSTPDVTCDHYHRWREDIRLMTGLGLGAYRFSIAWPRVVPTGKGPANPRGLDFYDALVDGLLAAGITPLPTLYHWDLPQALQDEGGWTARATAERFLDYTAAVVRRLGDRVKAWTTHNEPWCAAVLGHEEGHHAPGLTDPAAALRAAHHLLLSHGWAADVIRTEAPGAEVGIVMIHTPAHPASDDEGDHDAARWFDGFFNRWYLDPVFHGDYPADAVADRVAAGHLEGPEMPFVRDGDLAAIAAPLDFLGLNYYSRAVLRRGPGGRPEAVPPGPPEALTDMGWEVYPDGLYEALTRVHRDYAPAKILIAENGAAYTDPVDGGGRIRDDRRIAYLDAHLRAAHRALADGVPLRGYLTWSLMDNFEWGFGFTKRFGLYHVDFASLERIPRDSARWYRETIAQGGLDDTAGPATQGDSRAH